MRAEEQTGRDKPRRESFLWLALLLIALAIVRSAIATRLDGFTLDEPYHIAAGVSYVKYHDFRVNPEQPPLVKLWVGTLIAATGFHLDPLRQFHDKPEERAFTMGATLRQNDPDSVQRRARGALFALNGLLLLALAFALRRVFGEIVALGALLFLAIDPAVAAHLPVVMMDLPVALCSAIAVALGARAFQTWRWGDLAACAGALGLALATKHSAPIVMLGIAAIGVWLALMPRPASAENSRGRKFGKVAALLAGAMLVLWATYFFRYAENRTGRESFNQPLSQKIEDVNSPSYHGVLMLMDKTRIVPRAYLWGFADTIHAGLEGRENQQIFLGRFYSVKAPRYFFPVAIGAKLPIGLSVLLLLGLFFFFRRRVPQEWLLPGGIVLGVALLFLLVLSGGATYGGVRHALPVVALLSVFAGISLAVAMESQGPTEKIVVTLAILAACASALPRMRPWGYFNEFAGGPANAYRYFVDEGLNLGQGTKELAKYAHRELQPEGERLVCWYWDSETEFKARGVDCFGSDPKHDEPREELPTLTGTIFVWPGDFAPRPYWDFSALRKATPAARFGNAFVFRGTFYLPGLAASSMYWRGIAKLYGEKPDEAAAEKAFLRSVELDPTAYFVHIQLGNLYLKRGIRDRALEAYSNALKFVGKDSEFRSQIREQIRRVSAGSLGSVVPLRDPFME
jgi:4-amino-4-deoxy-L-arabinose transferase-like glycosyltransferase